MVVHAHRTADDFSHVGHEQVDRLGVALVARDPAHVKRFLRAERRRSSARSATPRVFNPDWTAGGTHNLAREVDEEDWPANHVGHLALSSLGNVVADDVFALDTVLAGASDAVLVEPLDRIAVVHAHERTRRWLEAALVAPQKVDQLLHLRVGQHAVDGLADLGADSSESACPELSCGRNVPQLESLTSSSIWLSRSLKSIKASSPSM